MNEKDREVLQALRDQTRQILLEHLGGVTRVALLDVPTYQNVGDSMIFAGELTYLRSMGVDIVYMSDIHRFDQSELNRLLGPAGVILLQGGGNFGDIWPEFQAFRENVVESNPHHRIIHLPQSVSFDSEANAQRTNDLLAQHPDFTLLLRESESIARGRRLLPDVRVEFCPDMALGWTPPEVRSSRHREVVLARRDRERAAAIAGQTTSEGAVERDWGLRLGSSMAWRFVRLPGRLARIFPVIRRQRGASAILRWGYLRMTNLNLRSGVKLFSSASHVTTDRLHAHVLAALMGIPHTVYDNSYGKIGAIYREYTHLFSTARFEPTGDGQAAG
ncbi:polysaccharide pyruvyl transferase family protein [Microbacterium sp. JC 701]|uniref:polysaccharide pyruvyl transferase family protein n=1 Tax=Microbacterium sp. JC 701 TaxID=2897389 RepID=UPI001E58E76A|nr:polysaccharide pyruvyl transferase family protein [Microbacterium sp. JC 701]MCD2170212.1 polysaccharide pyruvyl transferase family protein [Microbacterium sp. JC 701]